MTTTPRGVFSPDDSDDWDLTVDLAAMAVSIDTAIGNAQLASAGLESALPASAPNGSTYFATDTNMQFIRRSGAWKRSPARFIGARVLKNIAQNSATSATVITWNNSADVYDTDNIYSTGATSRMTVPFPGIWRFSWVVKSSGTIAITSRLRVNGTTRTDTEWGGDGASGAGTTNGASDTLVLAASDYVEVEHIAATAGTGFNINACRFECQYLGEL